MTGHHDAGTLWKASLTPVRGTAGRGVTATWVYTFVALVFFELIVIVIWTSTFRQAGLDRGAVTAVLFGGLLWVLSTVRLLRAYRHRTGDTTAVHWSGTPLPLAVAVFCGVLGWALSGLWVLLLPVAQSLQLLDWPRSIRARMVLGVTALLIGAWVVDVNVVLSEPPFSDVADPFVLGAASIILPLTTVMSLWWWDVLIALDRARVSEARLAATQERLSVATDVHDLQGHHLQVIALQLELAERLLHADPIAALDQL